MKDESFKPGTATINTEVKESDWQAFVFGDIARFEYRPYYNALLITDPDNNKNFVAVSKEDAKHLVLFLSGFIENKVEPPS